jgi:hypothetical protein
VYNDKRNLFLVALADISSDTLTRFRFNVTGKRFVLAATRAGVTAIHSFVWF